MTRDIADRLARLARSLEGAHPAEDVAHFLMRCLFTMFAEDVGLFRKRAFTQLLADSRLNVASFPPLVEELWRTMAHGGFSVALRVSVPHFDGGLFEDVTAPPLSVDHLQLLIEAAQPIGATWSLRSSARCWCGRWTRPSGTSWARTSPRVPTSSGW